MQGMNGSRSPNPSNLRGDYKKRKIDLDLIDLETNYIEKEVDNQDDSEGVDVYYKSPEDFKAVFNTKVSGRLASMLWLFLGATILTHLLSIFIISCSVFKASVIEDFDAVDKASDILDKQYSGIYAFLGTLTASITACYFASVSNVTQKSDD